MAYDSPDYLIRREHCAPPTVAGATTESAKFRSFQAMKLKKVHAFVVVAGTADAHAFNVFHGTTSVGVLSTGTSTAGSIASSALLNLDVAAGVQVSVKSLADVVGTAQIVYEYEVRSDAVES